MKRQEEHVILEPERLHKRQTALHVLLPVIATGVICLAVCTLLLVSTSAEPQSTEQWAQISTMFLILPAFFLGLTIFAFLILLANQSAKWRITWPPALRNIRLIIIHLEKRTQALAQKPAQPVISIKSFWAGIKVFFKK